MIKLHILAVILILFGALNTTANLFNTNFIQKIGEITNDNISRLIYIIIGLSVLYILFDRNVYLPFLGESVFPCNVLKQHTPTISIRIWIHLWTREHLYAFRIYFHSLNKCEN